MHFIMLIDTVDQELRQATVRVACHCCMLLSDASARKIGNDWMAGD